MGGGTQLAVGTEITTTQTIYIFDQTGTTPNCYDEESFTVTVNPPPTVSLTPIDTVCTTDGPIQLVGSPTSPGTGIYSGDGVSETGLFNPGLAGEGTHTIRYTYTDENGCYAYAEIDIVVENCVSYCSYTQGFYGNEGGLGCVPETGERENAQYMMEMALNKVGGEVIFGNINTSYFRITMADVTGTNAQIFVWLPGGGTPKAFTKPGDNTSPSRIKNNLLAQSITMFFNTQLNEDIGNWELKPMFYTSESKGCGSDEGYYKTDTYYISQSVINYLNANYEGATVFNLLQLANDVLGGIVTDISASSVSSAADAINNGFDECRVERSEPNSDEDSYPDSVDNCIYIPNEDQLDSDGDGIGDVCDECPFDADNDIDGDGVCGDIDNCPSTYNPNQLDTDGDGIGDVCDECPFDADNDIDGDGVCGDIDNCPSTYNPNQLDTDGDGIGDVCDECPFDADNDADGDGVCGNLDICPGFDDTIDSDGDGVPDGCDLCEGNDDTLDTDTDGIPDGCDNCIETYNPDQSDSDGNGIGDACEEVTSTQEQTFLKLSEDISAYPNPAKDVLNVAYKYEYDTNVTIQIYNINGSLIYDFTDNNYIKGTSVIKQIDISRIANQTVIVKLITKGESISKSVIINNGE